MSNCPDIIIIKIGTSAITKGSHKGINFMVLNRLAAVAAKLQEDGFKVLIVSSGAKGLGLAKLGAKFFEDKIKASPDHKGVTTSYKQALTAVGQVELMKAYENVFRYCDIHIGQVLITHKGLDDTERNETIKNTLAKMLELDILPVINANDTVSSKELEYGDNDSLAARIGVLVKASKLIILSDVHGFYDKDPNKFSDAKLLTRIEKITPELKALAGDSSSSGTGGMSSKVEAAETCINSGIGVEILHIDYIEQIPEIISGNLEQGTIPRTVFLV